MEAVRIIEKVESDSLVINHLSAYIGKEVEIIVLPVESNVKETNIMQLYGSLKTDIDGLDFQKSARNDWK